MTTRRHAVALVVLLATAASCAVVLLDAGRRRAREAASARTARAVVSLVGLPDLALSSTSRWLRHPSQVEPWAAVSDHPASLDTEPAGAVLGPPFVHPD